LALSKNFLKTIIPPAIKRVMNGMIQANVLTRKGGKRYGHWDIEVKE